MQTAGFHALSWDCPNIGIEVDFIPSGTSNFAASSSCQNGQSKSKRTHSTLVSKAVHKGRKFSIWQGLEISSLGLCG